MRRSGLAARLAFLALLAGGLVLWAGLRQPRDLAVEVDLTGALPGDLVEVDVVVSRGGRALTRFDQRYGPSGAPGILRVPLRARPGAADVEVTVVEPGGRGRRVRAEVVLSKERPARVAVH